MIGIISDTHGLLRPEAYARLAGVDHIIHAGDIGRPEVIAGLRELAPTTAIRMSGPMRTAIMSFSTMSPKRMPASIRSATTRGQSGRRG